MFHQRLPDCISILKFVEKSSVLVFSLVTADEDPETNRLPHFDKLIGRIYTFLLHEVDLSFKENYRTQKSNRK